LHLSSPVLHLISDNAGNWNVVPRVFNRDHSDTCLCNIRSPYSAYISHPSVHSAQAQMLVEEKKYSMNKSI
jgi:hypothetical protein